MIGGMFGPIGSMIGSAIDGLMSKFGMSNLAGALTNILMESLGSALKGSINSLPYPQSMKDAANEGIDNLISSSQHDTTTECQAAARDSDVGAAFDKLGYSIAQQSAEEADEHCNGGEGSKNWLVALAGALSKVQAKFLNDAMKNMDTMEKNMSSEKDSDKVAGQKRDKFLKAQSHYQANMQMFNMVANMTATSLKSLGEGLTAIARNQ